MKKSRSWFLRIKKLLSRKEKKLEKKSWIYYVNGAGTLLPPLSKEKEFELVCRMRNDVGARNLLIEHNLRLVVYIAKRFENTGLGIEDLVSIGTVGLIKATNTFKPEKNIKLATYASRCIENEILMYIRKHANERAEVSIDEPLNTDWDGNELLLSDVLCSDDDKISIEMEQLEERKRVREAVLCLEEREREIIEFRYGLNGKCELTQKEVADRLGISQSYISRLEKKIIVRLRAQMEKK